MGKPPKKKGGKKDAPKEEPSQSTETVEEPSTSEPPKAEAEDDSGLTGAARKKKEKKEKKEKALQALQALQASRKPSSHSESTSRTESEVPSEQPSRAQSEAPSESPAEAQPPSKAPADVPPKKPVEPKAEAEQITEEAEDVGLGLTGAVRKKKPRKKKVDAQPTAGPQEVEAVTSALAALSTSGSSQQVSSPVSDSGPVPLVVQMPEHVKATPPGSWGRGPQGIATTAGPPPGMPAQQMPLVTPIPTPTPPLQSVGHGWTTTAGPPPGMPAQRMPLTPTPHSAGRGRATTAGSSPGMPAQQMPRVAPIPTPTPPPQSAGRGWASTAGPPPGMPAQQMPRVAPIPTPTPPPQSAGRGWASTAGPPPGKPAQQMPLATPIPTSTPTPTTSPDTQTSSSQQQAHPTRPPKSLEPVLCRYKIPTKIPGGSVAARNIRVLVNYLEMQFKSLKISRYDVTFTPDKPKKMLPEVFAKVKAKFFPKDLIAFDQMKNCYSLVPLKQVSSSERFNTNVEIIDHNGKTMSFEVSMKATGVVDLDNIRRYMVNRSSSLCHPTEEIQCIDVILRQGALESYIKAGRQFFKRPLHPVDLGYGYEMWTGMFQSAIFTSKAFINIDVAHKGFPKHQKLLDALVKDFNLDPSRLIDNQRGGDYFASFVKGLKVVAKMVGDTPSVGQRREYVCNALVGAADGLSFNMNLPDGGVQKISVLNYFNVHKKYKLMYPKLNCLWVGHRDRCIYFPIELLEVAEGQPINRQLNEFQVSKMVREAATPPNERLKKITEVISDMKYSQNRDFKKFGLDISDKFYTVNAKVLDPPVLEVGSGKAKPRNGQWQANRLLKPEPLQSWGLIAVDTDPRNDYNTMIELIISTGTSLGMNVAKPKLVNVNAKMNTLRNVLLHAYKDVRLMFIIVSARGRDDYHKVKQLAEREVGMLTQCVKEMTARRMNPMTAKNILLKVNSKLMGINQAIDIVTMPRCLKEGGVMIVGADVTHPSPDQSNVPSIAAVTASLDAKCFIYNIELSIQTPKKEVIVEFEDMMFDHLKLYVERNRMLPRKIFVFRDGVSEGQFAQVMNSELAAVHIAYQRLAGPAKKPEVLFLLVQKRHHTRLFNQGGNMNYNVEPGTVVDTDIVHASELDFYLVSHQAIKGTARPTRYHAVCNDGKIPDDEVEQLTFYLCHLYSRCMRSVSYPTPTYYAHLACMRARSLTHGEVFDNRELECKPKRLRVLDKMLQFSRMFFV